MKKKIIKVKKTGCVAFATTVLGDKWTPRLLFALANGPLRFCALQQEAGGVNPRTLSKRVDDLENMGIISKAVYPEVPAHTDYTLTKMGRDLMPILTKMASWSEKYANTKLKK